MRDEAALNQSDVAITNNTAIHASNRARVLDGLFIELAVRSWKSKKIVNRKS